MPQLWQMLEHLYWLPPVTWESRCQQLCSNLLQTDTELWVWSPALCSLRVLRTRCLEGIETNLTKTQKRYLGGGRKRKEKNSFLETGGACSSLNSAAGCHLAPSICRRDSLGELPSALAALSGGRHRPPKNTLFSGVVSDILFLYDDCHSSRGLVSQLRQLIPKLGVTGAELLGVKMHKGALFWEWGQCLKPGQQVRGNRSERFPLGECGVKPVASLPQHTAVAQL